MFRYGPLKRLGGRSCAILALLLGMYTQFPLDQKPPICNPCANVEGRINEAQILKLIFEIAKFRSVRNMALVNWSYWHYTDKKKFLKILVFKVSIPPNVSLWSSKTFR